MTISLSNEYKKITEIIKWYELQKESTYLLKNKVIDCFIKKESIQSNIEEFFLGFNFSEIQEYFDNQLSELEIITNFNLIASSEALLRRDFYLRIKQRKKDEISKEFKKIRKKQESRISLEDNLLKIWMLFIPEIKKYIDDYKKLLKYRHWLAHGRYWLLESRTTNRKYSIEEVVAIISILLDSMDIIY